MKLSTRILLLVVPALLISTAVSSYIIFALQKDTLVKREESFMQLQMEKLGGHFKQASSFLNSYIYTLTNNQSVKEYFSDVDNPNRELDLIESLQESVNALRTGNETFAGLAIVDGQFNLLYYAESSSDPYTEIDLKTFQYFVDNARKEPLNQELMLAYNSFGEHVLLRYNVIDARTGRTPHRVSETEVFYVLVTVSLESFNQLKTTIEYETESALVFNKQKPNLDDNHGLITIELAPNLYTTLSPAAYLVNNKITHTWNQVTASFIIAGLITIAVILLILYRYVLHPITFLDKQLLQVERKAQTNIEKLRSKDELGRLSNRIFDMYEELDTSYQKTKLLAERDHLTHLLNRRHFQHLARQALNTRAEDVSATLFYIDLDNFKFVNDKYGHSAGDELLIEFANFLVELTSNSGELPICHSYVSRLSGDEFTLLVMTPKAFDTVPNQIAQAILASKERHPILKAYPVTVSVGLASFPQDGSSIERLISNADAAMYQAKENGKNRYAFYSEDINLAIQRRADIEHSLRKSSVVDELSLNYQPYLSADASHIVGVEVLVRWNSPTLGTVWPDEFIPIAEARGLFGRIDRYVIDKAFSEYAEIQQLLGFGTEISINISSAELDTLTLAEYIEEKRQQYDVKAELIEFEITETYSYEASEYPLLERLAKLGFQLAIDDFGSGYTSLTQLVQYPVQKIKFDRMFLNSLIETDNKHVLEPLIQLCHLQQKLVTAEGIENEQMHQWLKDYNCDLMQGYHFARPMNMQQLQIWFEQYQKRRELA